jgi:hypothetical protein
MTAEVVALNKSAIALAADSVVTVSRGGTQEKTYNVNKLFRLSKFHPVGIMVYDSAEVTGVPWETAIKMYRSHLGKKSFPTVRAYADDLRRFLGRSTILFSAQRQRVFFLDGVRTALYGVRFQARKKLDSLARTGQKIGRSQVRLAFQEAIKEELEWLEGFPLYRGVSREFAAELGRWHSSAVNQLIRGALKGTSLSSASERRLKKLLREMFIRHSPLGETGIIVAGFGDDEILPGVSGCITSGVLKNRLVCDNGRSYNQNDWDSSVFGTYGAVLAYAQTDVVTTFLDGVHPQFLRTVLDNFSELLDKYPLLVAEKAGITDAKALGTLLRKLRRHKNAALANAERAFDKLIDENQREPLLEVVSVLPRDELASIAAALVELTSIKRKMSRGIETVGGPVDVAVISKADGFVWISRKHYFKQDLNIHYGRQYFQEITNEPTTSRARAPRSKASRLILSDGRARRPSRPS